ncbi:MAG: hypothetical protein HFH66_16035 [Lachnospiraceae bacterium]|nr:hypothetical protein [Lachnospiraceae bacterium]
MTDNDFLYHYTSIQTLALILKNKKFKFNNLFTDDEDDLKPSVVSRSENGINIYFAKLGKYKRKYWYFQQECRYKICTVPWTMEKLENIKIVEEQVELFNNRILDKNTDCYCNEIYLDLADDAFENMGILL